MRMIVKVPRILAVLASPVLLVLFCAVAPVHAKTCAVAQVSYTDGEVAIQPADKTQSSGLSVDTPIRPGDRILTGDASRAAFQLPGSIIMRVDSGSTIGFPSTPKCGSQTRSMPVVRLSSGSMYIRTPERNMQNPVMEVVTPSATIVLVTKGIYRVDVGRDEAVQVSVLSGRADVEAQSRTVKVKSGRKTLINYGEVPGQVTAFDPYYRDDFATWNTQQDIAFGLKEFAR
jgi:ferric-dicitrate binding protein FerR (iron transport regulator)